MDMYRASITLNFAGLLLGFSLISASPAMLSFLLKLYPGGFSHMHSGKSIGHTATTRESCKILFDYPVLKRMEGYYGQPTSGFKISNALGKKACKFSSYG